eukprot:8112816-Karenia_brevis.AAC.1
MSVQTEVTKQVRASNEQREQQVQSAMHGQGLVLSIQEIIEARCKPIQRGVDTHSAELEAFQATVSQLSRKMEAMQQQMQMDDTKRCQSNSVAYGRPADPTVLK